MSVWIYNSLIMITGLAYVFAIVGIMDFAVKKGFPQDLSRKVVHIAAGSWLIFWPLFDASHWTKYLNIAPAALWTILLLIKGFTAKEDDQAVKTMTRYGDRRELLKGPLYFTIVMNVMGTIFFSTSLALTAMGILGWGDGLAPVFGKKMGKHKYNFVTEKSLEGSIAFFLFGLFGALLFNILFATSEINYVLILICITVTTILEALSPKDLDNLIIPVAVIVLYSIFN